MKLRRLITIVAVIGLVVAGIFVYKIYSYIFSPNTAFNNEVAYVYINTGATFADVENNLTPLLKDISSFEQVAIKKGYAATIRPGKYIIKKGMNNNDIINTLRAGNNPINITFNNQDTLEKLAGRIAGQIEADSTELVTAMKDSTFLATHDFTAETALAMYIPNTYEFFWNTSATEFRDRMFREYTKFWSDDKKAKAAELSLTPVQVSILASIVQKETAQVTERRRVAGVYVNRLQSNWLLEADPTIIYAMKLLTGDQDLVIKRVLDKHKELTATSPYNTYKQPGLPPGTISMPDVSSINAVLNYEKHDYYFFVADVSNFGYHKFSKTLAQHNKNAALYHEWVSKQNYQ